MVGPFDKRTRRRRCDACARRRIKCHGGIPCHYCQISGQTCVPPKNPPAQDAVFVVTTGKPEPGPETQKPPAPINSNSSLVNIPPTVSSDPSTLLTHYFFADFLAANSFATGSHLVPSMLISKLLSSPSIQNAAVAVGALAASRDPSSPASLRSPSSPNPKLLALQAYRVSCNSLHISLISESSSVVTTTTLWITFLLGFFELMFESSSKAWIQHMLHGSTKILELRGAKNCTSGSGRDFFETARIFEICRALLFAEPTFLANADWRELSEGLWKGREEDWHPKEAMYDLMVLCADLRMRTINLVRESSPMAPCPGPQLLAQAADGKAIQRSLHQWHTSFLIWEPPVATKHTPAHQEQNLIAQLYYHSMLIFLSGIFDHCHYWDEYEPPTIAVDEVERHVQAIVNLCERGLKMNLTGLLFFFPLRMAGARSKGQDEQARIVKMLGKISERNFVAADSVMTELQQSWRLNSDKKNE